MKRLYAVILVSLSLFLFVFASCIGREAAARQEAAYGEPRSESEIVETGYGIVTFYQGDMVIGQEVVELGSKIQSAPADYAWSDATGAMVDPTALEVTGDMNFYVRQAALYMEHTRYITGENNLFRPDDPITRAEAAEIFCALLAPEEEIPTQREVFFTDVTEDNERYESIYTMAAMGIMCGYPDGTFQPDKEITRAEFVTMLCRLTGLEEIAALAFSDVTAGYWALEEVAAVTTEGWIVGYEDGNFYPEASVTRAEAVVMINHARGRTPNKMAINMVTKTLPYMDVPRSYWAFYDIIDASFSSELMAYILGEVEGVEPGFILIGEDLCHVNPETLLLDYFAAGFHTIEDGLETDGLYYVPENGYFVQRNTPGLKELDGSMFYVDVDDGPFLTDYKNGYLYFGENGRYTSGDEVVDAYVDQILANIIDGKTSSLLNESKLYAGYLAIRDGGYSYMTRNTGWVRGSTSWALGCARVMFQTKRGSCFYWAAAFLYVARRLGYQAYPICGGVNQNALHAWVMIDEDGIEYIYDVELEWGYMTGAGGRYGIIPGLGSLFKQRRGASKLTYIFPGDTYYAPPSDEEDMFDDTDPDMDIVDSLDDFTQNEDGTQMEEGTDYTVSVARVKVDGVWYWEYMYHYLTGSRAGTTRIVYQKDSDQSDHTDDPQATEKPEETPKTEEPNETDNPEETPKTEEPEESEKPEEPKESEKPDDSKETETPKTEESTPPKTEESTAPKPVDPTPDNSTEQSGEE